MLGGNGNLSKFVRLTGKPPQTNMLSVSMFVCSRRERKLGVCWYSSGSSSMDSHVCDQLQYLTSSVKHLTPFTTLQTSHQFEKCLAWLLQITPVVCNNSRCVGHHVIFLLIIFWLLVAECETESQLPYCNVLFGLLWVGVVERDFRQFQLFHATEIYIFPE